MAKPGTCPSCRSAGPPKDGCNNLWHIEVRPARTHPSTSAGASPGRPYYAKFKEEESASFWGVTVDEGWRSPILCTGMYEWAADWLIGQIQGKPLPAGH